MPFDAYNSKIVIQVRLSDIVPIFFFSFISSLVPFQNVTVQQNLDGIGLKYPLLKFLGKTLHKTLQSDSGNQKNCLV